MKFNLFDRVISTKNNENYFQGVGVIHNMIYNEINEIFYHIYDAGGVGCDFGWHSEKFLELN